jgi:threonine/homoserine/homoserine lactone efflux protein
VSLDFLIRGFALGFSIAAPVGPIGILCIRRTLAEGRASGLASGLGAATADALYGCVAAFGLVSVSAFLVGQQTWLRIAGGVFLSFLGLRAIASRPSDGAAALKRRGPLGAYVSTFALTLTNPMTIVSFAAVFAGVGVVGGDADYASAGSLVAGVFLGSAAWWLILSLVVGALRQRISPRVLRWVNVAAGAAMLGFGAWILISGL